MKYSLFIYPSFPLEMRLLAIGFFLLSALSSCKKSEETATLPPGVTKGSDGIYYVEDVVTWPNRTDDGSADYEFDAQLTVKGRLTIEPGVKIVFHHWNAVSSYSNLNVSGNIVAIGTPDKPIEIGGDGKDGSFIKIHLQNNNSEVNIFEYCIIDRAWATNNAAPKGSLTYVNGLIESYGNPYNTSNINVKVNHCTFKNGELGVKFGDNVNLLEFNHNTFSTNLIEEYCGLFDIHSVHALNNTNNFAGNINNKIAVVSNGPGSYPKLLDDAVTIHKLNGADYTFDTAYGSTIVIGNGSISLEPGIESIFPVLCSSGNSPSITGNTSAGYSIICN